MTSFRKWAGGLAACVFVASLAPLASATPVYLSQARVIEAEATSPEGVPDHKKQSAADFQPFNVSLSTVSASKAGSQYDVRASATIQSAIDADHISWASSLGTNGNVPGFSTAHTSQSVTFRLDSPHTYDFTSSGTVQSSGTAWHIDATIVDALTNKTLVSLVPWAPGLQSASGTLPAGTYTVLMGAGADSSNSGPGVTLDASADLRLADVTTIPVPLPAAAWPALGPLGAIVLIGGRRRAARA